MVNIGKLQSKLAVMDRFLKILFIQNADFQDGVAKGKSATKALRFCLYLAIDQTFQMRYQMFLQHNQFWIYQLSNLKSENTNKSPFKYGNGRKKMK